MNFLKKIWRLCAVNWSTALQYRGDLVLWTIAEAATPLISLAVWYSVSSNSDKGLSPIDTFTYYILVMFVVVFTSAWGGFFLAREILQGDIVTRLIKPLSPFWALIANNTMEKALRLSIPLPLLLFSIWFWPQFFSAGIFESSRWPWFIVSLILAASLAFLLDIIFATIAFWLEDAVQLRWYKDTLQMLTSGIFIPIAFMPQTIQHVVNKLPFRHIITTPIDIILGHTNPDQIKQLVTSQALWVVCFTILLTLLWKRGLKRYAPPGQ